MKKIKVVFQACLISLIFLQLFTMSSFAEEVEENFQGDGAVGFYGEYIFVEEPEPEPPAKVIPKPAPEPKPTKPTSLAKLPQTDGTVSRGIMVLGMLLISLISLIILIRKRRISNEKY